MRRELTRGKARPEWMDDPTYDIEEIAKNPTWQLAFDLSEIHNDGAPIGWSRYTFMADCLLKFYEMKRK